MTENDRTALFTIVFFIACWVSVVITAYAVFLAVAIVVLYIAYIGVTGTTKPRSDTPHIKPPVFGIPAVNTDVITWNTPTTLNNTNMYMSGEDKRDYLRSTKFRALRLQRLLIAKYCCESCGTSGLLECHHLHYRTLGSEQIDDLRMLCRTCHQNIHDKFGYDRETFYPIFNNLVPETSQY